MISTRLKAIDGHNYIYQKLYMCINYALLYWQNSSLKKKSKTTLCKTWKEKKIPRLTFPAILADDVMLVC